MTVPIAANDNDFGFYTYVWRRTCGQPFYVGKGRGRRAYDTYDRSDEFNEIYTQGGCTVEIADWFIHESQALAHEVELIFHYGRCDYGGVLVNKTDGGDGCVGHIKTPEALEKWRAKNIGRKNTAETIAKISAGKMGHSVSKEARAKMSAAGKRRFEDEAERAKVGARASNPGEETRLRMSAAQTLRMSDPARRAHLSEALTGKRHTTETRTQISATMTGVPKSEDTIASMRVAQRMKPGRGAYKGVSASGNKWRAIIGSGKSTQSLGTFAIPEDAARTYDRAAIAAWGLGNCYLNFPPACNDNEPQSMIANAV